ncbi:MAG TPA: HlyD family efflux transporter periplasmic adaptor subunit [Rhodopseudomonas sp.]|uniref:HlyD family efflux transporter periplasmic adaptor subunit n=1 Tax=Rhodopseudomonas sp. TaxID=1078 RepID=UPI002EDB5619
MNPRLKIILPIAGVALLAAAAVWWWTSHRGDDDVLTLQGNVEVRQVNLGFKVSGRIAALNVDEGARVDSGDKLASLDAVYFEDNLRQMRAQRDQSAANLAKMIAGNRPQEIAQAEALVSERDAANANAKVSLDRATQLLKSAAGTQKTYDDAAALKRQTEAQLASANEALRLMKAGFRQEDIDLARAQLADKEAAIRIAERQRIDADLLAPTSGVVLSRVRELGAIVNAGETVFVLCLTTPVWVRSYVSEQDLGRIKPGMAVELRSDTAQIKPLKGTVGFISTTAEFTPKTVETRELRTALVYRIRVITDDPDNVLRQGMPMTIVAHPAAAATPPRGVPSAEAK